MAIPPAQAELLRQEIDALYRDTNQNRFRIAETQQELDQRLLDVDERIDDLDSRVDAGVDGAALVNEDNTFANNKTNSFLGDVNFNKTTTIAAPGNNFTDPTFEIRGTARTGTVDSRVFYAMNNSGKLQIRYRGPIVNGDEIVNKDYVK